MNLNITGTNKSELLLGTNLADIINGLFGNDTIFGRGGFYYLSAGE